MRCEIISTGSEIMNGTIVDTNSNYIMKKLYNLGIEVDLALSVSDNKDKMIKVFKESFDRSDLIYIIGGLGPTKDDFTKEIVSEITGLELMLEEDIISGLRERYKKRNMEMPENNIKQAYVPNGATVLYNNHGTAPGIYINIDNKKIFLFPGPPRELVPMFDSSVEYLHVNNISNTVLTINTLDIGESKLELLLDEIERQEGIEIVTYPKDNRVDIQIKYKSDLDSAIIDNLIKSIEDKLVDKVYGYNNKSLEEMVLNKLLKNNLKVAFAESCTGGLLSSRLTDIPGSSEVLNRSLVVYTYDAKEDELGVSRESLREYGAVSSQVALEMARGVRIKSNVDIGVSVTGVAGPGKSENKDEGLVYIGISTIDNDYYREFNFTGKRKIIKHLASSQAFVEILKNIKVD